MEKYHFVFDIDGAMVYVLEYNRERKLKRYKEYLSSYLLKKMSVTSIGYTHLIFPGYYELFRWMREEGFKISFFSSAIRERNEDFVPKFIKRIFGKGYEKILKDIKIYSRDHLYKTSDSDDPVQGKHFGNYKKILLGTVVNAEEELKRTILIDDDISYITASEEKNFLQVPYTSEYYWKRDYEKEDLWGFHKAYYIRGILEKAFKIKKESGENLPDILFELQGKFENAFYHESREKRNEYCKIGLKLLKKYNRKLRLY